jgi:hypothetical protein
MPRTRSSKWAGSIGYAVGYGLDTYVAEIRHAEKVLLVGAILSVGGFVGWRMLRTIWRR